MYQSDRKRDKRRCDGRQRSTKSHRSTRGVLDGRNKKTVMVVKSVRSIKVRFRGPENVEMYTVSYVYDQVRYSLRVSRLALSR